MHCKKFLKYVMSGLVIILLQSCFTKSKISFITREAEHCNHLGISYYQSLDLVLNNILYKTKNITYHSDDGEKLKYISIRLKIPHSYVLIYPDYSELSPIALPPKGEKLNSLILKKYKASRITYTINNQIYDCIGQEYLQNMTTEEIQNNNADLCAFINRPAKELLEYFNADSSQTVLFTPINHFPETLTYYTSIMVKLNETDSVFIHTMPNISIKDYDQLRKDKVTIHLVKQFPIGSIEYYYNKSKKFINFKCSCKKC